MVANRLPVDKVVADDGVSWRRSPGGLVTALEPILRQHTGAWVGWSGIADSDDNPDIEGIDIHAVPLSTREIAEYYEGFSNATLWPLYHDVIVKPGISPRWWNTYVEVNRRTRRAASTTAAHGALVWVQDYQLQLVPRCCGCCVRTCGSASSCISRSPIEAVHLQNPWRTEIVEGLLGADLISSTCRAVRRTSCTSRARLAGQATSKGHRRGAFPGSVWCRWVSAPCASMRSPSPSTPASSTPRPVKAIRARAAGSVPNSAARRRSCWASTVSATQRYRRPPHGAVGTAGRKRLDPHDTVMVQLATPAANASAATSKMRAGIRATRRQYQRQFRRGRPARRAVSASPRPRDDLIAFFVAADVMLVTPLRDGMNLVAKVRRLPQRSRRTHFVLSRFTGAAARLKSAYQANPYDLDGVKDAIELRSPRPGRRAADGCAPCAGRSSPRRRQVGPQFPRRPRRGVSNTTRRVIAASNSSPHLRAKSLEQQQHQRCAAVRPDHRGGDPAPAGRLRLRRCALPIVSQPEDAVPNPASVAAIESAAALPNTSAAVVSAGRWPICRCFPDCRPAAGHPLIGSHGTESSTGFVTEVTDGDRARLARIVAEFDTRN